MIRLWKYLLMMILMVIPLLGAATAVAEIEGEVIDTRAFTKPPVDLLLSSGGEYLYVLLPGGHLEVYDRKGKSMGTIKVDPVFKKLRQGPSEDLLWLSTPARTEAQLLAVNIVREIPTTGSPSQGPADAPVTIVIFSDFECGFCARMAEMLQEVRLAFPEEVRVVFKNFPLRGHRYSVPAAQAALAAGTMGKFWAFHDALFENFDQLDEKKIEEIRDSLGLDKETFKTQMQAPQVIDALRGDMRLGREVKVTGTPTVFVNGRHLRKPSMDNFFKVIEARLEE
jgi:protein-disulfide isomerase